MKCSYIYPREEDWILASILEDRRPGALLGVRGSGVTTALERAVRLSSKPPRLVGSVGEALELCKTEYVAADVDPGSLARLVSACSGIFGASGSLAWLVTMGPRLPSRIDIVVLKPLSPPEAQDYLRVLGIVVDDERLVEEIVFRTGGMPGELCRMAVEGGWRGSRITRREVEALPEHPKWLVDAEKELGRELFIELMRASALGAFTENLAEQVGLTLDRPWIVGGREGLYTIWPEIAWLQPFAVRWLGLDEVRELYAIAEGYKLPGYVKYTHSSILYKLTGGREYARKALQYGEEAFNSFDSRVARARIASTLTEAARTLGDARRELKWLASLVEEAPGPLTGTDYSEALMRGRRAYLASRDLHLYLELLSALARRAAGERMVEVLEMVMDELETLYAVNRGRGRVVEAYYLTVEAIRDMITGNWASASRSLEEAVATGHAPKTALLMLGVVKTLLWDFEGARRVISEARSYLDPSDVKYLESLVSFMSRSRPPRPKASPPKDARIALMDSLSMACRGVVVEPPDPEVAPIVRALAKAARGDVKGSYWELKPLLEDGVYTPINLLGDVFTAIAQARSDPKALKASASVLRRLASAAEAGGNMALARPLRAAAEALERGDLNSALWAAAKLTLTIVYMVG